MLARAPSRRFVVQKETMLRGTLGVMLALSCVSFIEPSPYEIFFFLLIPVALFTGLALTPTTLTFFLLVFAIVVAQLVALFPYMQHAPLGEGNLTPLVYTVYTVYLYASAVLFALIFSRNSGPRLTLAIKAYAASCVFAGLWGFASYSGIGGLDANEPILGRVAGPFKDPNVLGSYCIFGALYFMQRAVLGTRWRLVNLGLFLIVFVGGVFFSFSRGSWLAMLFSTLLMGASTYVTADKLWVRRRLHRALLALVVLGFAGGLAIVSTPALHDTVLDRAKVEQDYDGGETGRFGNQKRSVNMLIERPFGLGPFRFPLYFTLQPHNSYIGAFADAGWIGGFAFILLVMASTLIALRLLFERSPLLRQAQVICPALIAFFLQAMQIDIDHWRFVFLMLGSVWGMHAALQTARSAAARGVQPRRDDTTRRQAPA